MQKSKKKLNSQWKNNSRKDSTLMYICNSVEFGEQIHFWPCLKLANNHLPTYMLDPYISCRNFFPSTGFDFWMTKGHVLKKNQMFPPGSISSKQWGKSLYFYFKICTIAKYILFLKRYTVPAPCQPALLLNPPHAFFNR